MRQALAAGGLDDRAAVEVAAEVLQALAHAHGRGIVHRDVKPSNVLLAESSGIDVRLLDFGLAQMAEFDTLTAMGDVPGTLGYISPERLLGKPATEAADIWAVGVMLWEALAGQHPFREGGLRETSRRIQTGTPPLQELRPDLPAPLCKAVASALALSPGRRPEAGALARAAPPPPHKPPRRPPPPQTAAQPSRGRRRRGARAGAAVLLAAVVAGFRHQRLPFDGSPHPLGLGISGSDRPTAVAYALWRELLAHPALLGEALALAVAAALLQDVRRRGPWRAAFYAS